VGVKDRTTTGTGINKVIGARFGRLVVIEYVNSKLDILFGNVYVTAET